MSLIEIARDAVARLAARNLRLALAESCTAGLAAATLARTPGVSAWLCGSAVVYREATKIGWLDVSPRDLERLSAVSEPVARQMAHGVLDITPEADLAAAITGHLGPGAPAEQDGVVHIAIVRRQGRRRAVLKLERRRLARRGRIARQREAAEVLLASVVEVLAGRR